MLCLCYEPIIRHTVQAGQRKMPHINHTFYRYLLVTYMIATCAANQDLLFAIPLFAVVCR